MSTKKRGIRAVLVVIGLPLVLVLFALVYVRFVDRTSGTIVSSGQKREYLLYVPRSYDRANPTPLVISMHALALWPAAQMETSHWNKVADEHGFIVVYPSGTGMLKIWRTHEPEPEAGLREDVRFISELIDTLEAAYNIDPARIYANGFSNGGAMASVLSCALSDRIAAVGTVAPAQDALPWSWFANCRPVPMIQFHGTADPFVPYAGGLSWPTPRPFPSVSTWAANWREETGADRTPSKLWWRRMSADSNTRTARTTRRWCSTPSGEEAIPGLAVSRCWSGGPDPQAAASTHRAKCGRSFGSIGFRESSKAARPTGAQII